MKYLGPTPLKVIKRIFLILFAAGVISGLLYWVINNGSSDWQFGSSGFTMIQNFNVAFARIMTGGDFAGEFRRRGIFGNSHFFAGLSGIIRSLILTAGITIGVVAVQKLIASITRLFRK